MRINRVGASAALLAASFLLSSCSTAQPTATPTPTPKAKTAAQVLKEFKGIAKASCAKAMAVGVVESASQPNPFTLVMVPKEQAYKDFSAAVLEGSSKYTLIYEADAFSSCTASLAYELGGGPTDVTFDPMTGKYMSSEVCYDGASCVFEYEVSGGLFSSFTNVGANPQYTSSIRYGNLTDADWEILHKAVDEQAS